MNQQMLGIPLEARSLALQLVAQLECFFFDTICEEAAKILSRNRRHTVKVQHPLP
jgi:hypothetical protein